MTGSRSDAADLTTRLNKWNIQDIFTRITKGESCKDIAALYKISYSSLVRILTVRNWTDAQRGNWEIETLKLPVWPEDTKRPKATYTPKPTFKRTKKTQPSDGHKSGEYDAGGDDANRYRDSQNTSLEEKLAPETEEEVIAAMNEHATEKSDPPSLTGLLPEATPEQHKAADTAVVKSQILDVSEEPHASEERTNFTEATVKAMDEGLDEVPGYPPLMRTLQDKMPDIATDPRIEEARAKIRTHRKVSQETIIAFNNVEAAWLLLTEEINELKNILNI
jgi:hypothetical protein